MRNSPIDFFNLKPFKIRDASLYEFKTLGKDKNTEGLVHTCYIHRSFMNETCEVEKDYTEINSNCKQFLIKNVGIVVGCLFVSRENYTHNNSGYLEIGKMKTSKNLQTIHFLEDFGVLGFKAPDGAVLLVARHVINPIVATIKDEDLQRS